MRPRAFVVAIAALVGAGAGSFEAASQPAFYQVEPSELPGAPGSIIRVESLPGAPPGAAAHRILYRSRGLANEPIAVSGVVVAPERPGPRGGGDVVAWAHGTTGIMPSCAPSLRPNVLALIPGLTEMLARGYVVAATDYPGLGTAGPHPYLVGVSEARAVLDSVRAARALPGSGAGARFAVWGHSQGGHAALFTGEEADTYAPELELAGVAAGAPATDLRRLLRANNDTAFGRVLAAYTLSTWSQLYPQLRLDRILSGPAREVVARVATLCLPADHGSLKAALGGQDVQLTYRSRQPWNTQPWRRLLERNSPGATPIPVPVIVTQGADDRAVRPALTARFVRRLCRLGTTVQYRPSRRVAHVDLGEKTAPYVSKWIVGRFAGRSARSSC